MEGAFNRNDFRFKLELLRLYNKLKRVIYQAVSLDVLLSEVCKLIVEHSYYDSAWIILSDNDKITGYYTSNNIDYTANLSLLDTPCYRMVGKAGSFVMISNKKLFCKNCLLNRHDDDNVVYAIPLKFKGEFYGAFSANVVAEFARDKENKNQFVELAEDISYAIYNLKLEERLRNEKKELVRSQYRFQSLLRASNNPVVFSDLKMNYIFASDNLKKLFGVSGDIDYNGTEYSPEKLLPPEEVVKMKLNFRRLINKELKYSQEIYHPVFKGIPFTVGIRSTLLYDSDAKPEGVASVIENLTQIFNAKEKLSLSERKFATVFEMAPTGISILNAEGYILETNKMDRQILGYPKEEIIGKHISYFFSKLFKDKFKSYYNEFLETGYKELDIELQRKNGETIVVRRSGRAVKDEKGNIQSIIVHSRDYTEIHAAQKRIKTLSEALNQVPSIVTMTDLNGDLIYVNKRFEEITGYTSKEVLGKNPRILKSDLYNREFYRHLWKTLLKGNKWRGRFLNRRKDGSFYWEHAIIKPFVNELGEVEAYLKAGEDISPLIEVENKLEESKRRYQDIFQIVPIPIAIHQNGIVIDANRAAINFVKANKETFVGSALMNYVHPSSKASVMKRIQQMSLSNERLEATEEKFYNFYGEVRDVEVIASPFLYRGNKAYMVVFKDITERKEWLEKLKNSESKFRGIFNTNPDAISISRISDGKFYEVNKGFCNISGYSEEELIGKTVDEINLYADIKDRDKLINQIYKNGQVDDAEIEFRIKDGSILTFLISARIITIANRKLLLFVSHDISDRKKMELELRKAMRKAEENDKLKSAFLANMSHEIRTPMNAIIGFSDLLKDEGLARREQIRYIDIIQNKGDDLMLLINDIIDISKIESGALEVECEDIRVKDVLDLLKTNYEAYVYNKSEGRLSFIIEECKQDDIFIRADIHRLNQVFSNLISNAVKFTDKGGINISVELIAKEVKFHVEDTGIGIPVQQFQRIFDRFSQINAINDTLVGGTGLGLCITKSLVELMNGHIEVNSTEGVGSIFTISIPIVNGPIAKLKEADIKVDVNLDLSAKQIVVLENDMANRAFISTILKSANASFTVFDDDDAFFSHILTLKKLDAVIIDLSFDRSNKDICVRKFKRIFPDAKGLGISADVIHHSDSGKIGKLYDDFLSKPFTKADLYKKLKALLF